MYSRLSVKDIFHFSSNSTELLNAEKNRKIKMAADRIELAFFKWNPDMKVIRNPITNQDGVYIGSIPVYELNAQIFEGISFDGRFK